MDFMHQLGEKNNAESKYRIMLFSEDYRTVKQGFSSNMLDLIFLLIHWEYNIHKVYV